MRLTLIENSVPITTEISINVASCGPSCLQLNDSSYKKYLAFQLREMCQDIVINGTLTVSVFPMDFHKVFL